jgi:tRNA(Ile)-lysidine synthase TilS/MesJ
VALGHHREDVLETLLLNLFYSGQLKAMPPKLRSDDGTQILLRPLFYDPETELQELSVQQKEQVIEDSRLLNVRAILRVQSESEGDRLQAQLEAEDQRRQYVVLNAANGREIADAEAYAIASRLKAYTELPVDNLKAMAMAHMQPEQLMAMAVETLAQNAGKIGELNITPDLFGRLLRKAGK